MQNVRCWVPVNFQVAADPTGAIAGFRFRPVTNLRLDGGLIHKRLILKFNVLQERSRNSPFQMGARLRYAKSIISP